MNRTPTFLPALLSSLEPLYKQALEYENSNLQPEQLFTKIAADVGEMKDPVAEIMAVSNNFRNMFKQAALKEGYSEQYVQGAFSEAEELCKTAILKLADGTLPGVTVDNAMPATTGPGGVAPGTTTTPPGSTNVGASDNLPPWVGSVGGGILAMLLARQMGMGGLGGAAAGLLGAWGGNHYLPQLMQYVNSHGGWQNTIQGGINSIKGMFNHGQPSAGAPGAPGVATPAPTTVTNAAIAANTPPNFIPPAQTPMTATSPMASPAISTQ